MHAPYKFGIFVIYNKRHVWLKLTIHDNHPDGETYKTFNITSSGEEDTVYYCIVVKYNVLYFDILKYTIMYLTVLYYTAL